MKYFISDIHFSDEITMKLENRPFKSVHQYDKYIIKMINKKATKNDDLYVIGDFFDCDDERCVGWKKTFGYINKIKANIILIIGNNEIRIIDNFFGGDFEAFRQVCTANGIKDVKVNDVVEFAGLKFFLTHEPKDHKNGFVNLCGHLHRSRGTWYSFGLNMSCDLNNFIPYSESDILFQLSQRDKYYNSDENFKII
jgi:calcineurin-like phosphoesterase family protein